MERRKERRGKRKDGEERKGERQEEGGKRKREEGEKEVKGPELKCLNYTLCSCCLRTKK